MSDIKINDFVIRFANVNGTGSASVNPLFQENVVVKFIRGRNFMILTIELKPETEAKLKNRVVALGFEVDDYIENLIEKDLDKPKTLDEIFAPVRQEFKEQGMTEDEFDDLIYQARREVYAEKKARGNK